ncbi:MAG: glycosyltransferase involved in cell wall biosynthesis [Candidatus Azotimanducaceae bacterium]|jgi:glycosyltransferase involved in cell wall biosynthesis
MRFLIITQVPHYWVKEKLFSYRPYVKEINLWIDKADTLEIIAPIDHSPKGIEQAYQSKPLQLNAIPNFHINNAFAVLKTLFLLPYLLFKMITACSKADHIHLRCPGNVGLLGVLVQFLFPSKIKTVKYAGNWDPKSRQPWSYKLQQKLLRSKCCKNMKVLVYGDWKEKASQIVPFFTATYSNKDATHIDIRKKEELRLLFVGVLAEGKRPLEVLKTYQWLLEKCNRPIGLHFCGKGTEERSLRDYVKSNAIEGVTFHGNLNQESLQEQYQKADFLLFPSKSEGWPKVVAEAMWWGCIPVTTDVSCLSFILGDDERGFLVAPNYKEIGQTVLNALSNPVKLEQMRIDASLWSRQYTLEKFGEEIKALVV